MRKKARLNPAGGRCGVRVMAELAVRPPRSGGVSILTAGAVVFEIWRRANKD